MAVTETILTANGDTVALDVEVFRGRLATLLREHRRNEGVRRRTLARRSNGRFTVGQLREAEEGAVSEIDAVELAALYGADLSAILPARTVIEVDPRGRVATAGIVETFEPGDATDVLTAYLRLVRRVRQQQRAPVVPLRRDDIEVLAAVLDEPGERVVDRLGALMGATRVQRRLMVGLFVSGAVVIGLAVTAVAATSGETPETEPTVPVVPTSVAAIEPSPSDEVVSGPGVADADESEAEGTDETPRVWVEFPPLLLEDAPPVVEPAAPDPAPSPNPPAPAAPPAVPPPAVEPPPTVAVGPPPVPTTEAPIVDPVPAEPEPPAPPEAPAPEPDPEPDEPIVATGPPPIPTTTPPIPGG